MQENALTVNHVTKVYNLYKSPRYRLLEAFLPASKKKYHDEFRALNDVTLTIPKGQKVGIIGSNGAGKSTLLKMITGVLTPTKGEIDTVGSIAALLELGAGFNREYTGIENIELNCKLMGIPKNRTEELKAKIIEFADIGDYVYQPVKTYSSGMFVRLAFATQIFSDPDILIVDEALSVGDIRFQQKCYRAMESLMEECTVLLVTHDTDAVARFCERVIWLNHGEVMFDGDVSEGLKLYQNHLINLAIEEANEKSHADDDTSASDIKLNIGDPDEHGLPFIPRMGKDINTVGNNEAFIRNCVLLNENNEIAKTVLPHSEYSFVMNVEFFEEIERPIFGITVRDRLGKSVIGMNSETLRVNLDSQHPGYVQYRLKFIMPELNAGHYTITPAIANGRQTNHVQLCWADDAIVFKMAQRQYDIPGTLYIERGSIETVLPSQNAEK